MLRDKLRQCNCQKFQAFLLKMRIKILFIHINEANVKFVPRKMLMNQNHSVWLMWWLQIKCVKPKSSYIYKSCMRQVMLFFETNETKKMLEGKSAVSILDIGFGPQNVYTKINMDGSFDYLEMFGSTDHCHLMIWPFFMLFLYRSGIL